MFVDLQKVPPEGQAVDRSMAPGSFDLGGEDFRFAGNVELRGRVTPVEESVFQFRGTVQATLEVPCVRCLDPVTLAVREELDLLYLPQSANVAPVVDEEAGTREFDRALSTDELAAAFYRDERIDLCHMILEQVILALPMKPLCMPDCRGLCPECGSNLNLSTCNCTIEETDPRWAALKTLLGR